MCPTAVTARIRALIHADDQRDLFRTLIHADDQRGQSPGLPCTFLSHAQKCSRVRTGGTHLLREVEQVALLLQYLRAAATPPPPFSWQTVCQPRNGLRPVEQAGLHSSITTGLARGREPAGPHLQGSPPSPFRLRAGDKD